MKRKYSYESAIAPLLCAERVCLYIGRFQPFHSGHAKIIKAMKDSGLVSVIGVIRGDQSSTDKKKNPFDLELQMNMFRAYYTDIAALVLPFTTGFIPAIVDDLRDRGLEVVKVFCGTDRICKYRTMVEDANCRIRPEAQMNIEFFEVSRDDDNISGTKVRQALHNGDYEAFKKMMPPECHYRFEQLQNIIKESKQ